MLWAMQLKRRDSLFGQVESPEKRETKTNRIFALAAENDLIILSVKPSTKIGEWRTVFNRRSEASMPHHFVASGFGLNHIYFPEADHFLLAQAKRASPSATLRRVKVKR